MSRSSPRQAGAFSKRPLRVLVSAGLAGGAGGAERALASILRALQGHEITVVARRVLPDAQLPSHIRTDSNVHWRWRGSNSSLGFNGKLARIVNPLRRVGLPGYDVHLRLFQGADLTSVVRARASLIVPSGNPVPPEVAAHYDFVAMQAPDNAQFVPVGASSMLLPPPLYPVSEDSIRPAVDLPERYFLTVFNPYGPIKGVADLVRASRTSPLPIVWCHSTASVAFEIPAGLADHESVVHVDGPSASELRYLYEHCAAYLSFSQSEGFGWSIADALRHTPAIVSRRIGILSNPEIGDPGIVIVDDPGDPHWETVLEAAESGPPGRDLRWHGPAQFRARLEHLAGDR